MNAEQSAPLRMIAQSAADAAASLGGPARARRVHAGAAAWEPASWKAIAELGWPAIAVPESAGGLQLGAPALCVVAEEAGRALLMPPLTMGMAAAAVLAGAGEAAAPTLRATIAAAAWRNVCDGPTVTHAIEPPAAPGIGVLLSGKPCCTVTSPMFSASPYSEA